MSKHRDSGFLSTRNIAIAGAIVALVVLAGLKYSDGFRTFVQLPALTKSA